MAGFNFSIFTRTFASHAYWDGRVVFADERGRTLFHLGHGVSGVLGFLLRLRHRSPACGWSTPCLSGATVRDHSRASGRTDAAAPPARALR